ncbi:hypothetical protein D3C81_2052430 [compost metagenome]
MLRSPQNIQPGGSYTWLKLSRRNPHAKHTALCFISKQPPHRRIDACFAYPSGMDRRADSLDRGQLAVGTVADQHDVSPGFDSHHRCLDSAIMLGDGVHLHAIGHNNPAEAQFFS